MDAETVVNGDACEVIAGTHKGCDGKVEGRNTSKPGNITITVREASGERFKTLERNVHLV